MTQQPKGRRPGNAQYAVVERADPDASYPDAVSVEATPRKAPVTSAERVQGPRLANGHGHLVPRYDGLRWLGGDLPTRAEPWLKPNSTLMIDPGFYLDEATREQVEAYAHNKPWVWPNKLIYLLSDMHADADAFQRSLVASGGVRKTGPADTDLSLTDEGKEATFVIAGDCFDKGPNNLRLLRALHHLLQMGAKVELLAGNHDVRAFVGVLAAGRKEPQLAHLFVRMGQKAVPLFRELCATYVKDSDLNLSQAEHDRLHALLFPDEAWFRTFPQVAGSYVPEKKVQQELHRIREKTIEFKKRCAASGLTLSHVHAALQKFREHFLQPGGDFTWFFDTMVLSRRVGSLLFVHAGVDDVMAGVLRREGVEGANRWFRQLLADRELFELYHGPVGNAFRTKYRDTDHPLTGAGVRQLHNAGVYGVVHGHRSIKYGQRIIFRSGMLNIECDASVDQNTRRLCGLRGPGAAVTIFRPDGKALGVSTDYPAVKVFEPASVARLVTLV